MFGAFNNFSFPGMCGQRALKELTRSESILGHRAIHRYRAHQTSRLGHTAESSLGAVN